MAVLGSSGSLRLSGSSGFAGLAGLGGLDDIARSGCRLGADPVAAEPAGGSTRMVGGQLGRRGGRRGGLVGLRVVRPDRVELLVDPRTQPFAAQKTDRALGGEDPGGGELEVTAIEGPHPWLAVDP